MLPSFSTGLAVIVTLSLALLPATDALPQLQSTAPDLISPDPGATDITTTDAAAPTTTADTPSITSSIGAACNNSPDLCPHTYNNVTHMGAHDSSFLRQGDEANNVAGNQYLNATVALDAGLRLLQVQVHVENGQLRMCHTLCSLYDAGLLVDWLAKIRGWMDAHPNDVVTLILVNSDGATAAEFGSLFEASGLAEYGYAPSESAAAAPTWPTLQEMISANTRLVTFVAPVAVDAAYPFLLSEFAYVFETSFEVTTPGGFNCALDRPARLNTAAEAVQANYMGMINHMLQTPITASIYIPAVDEIATTNSDDTGAESSLGRHVQECAREWGVRPQFVLVDFWNEGSVMAVADSSNALGQAGTIGRKQPAPAPAPAGGADASAHRAQMGPGAALFIAVVAAVVLF